MANLAYSRYQQYRQTLTEDFKKPHIRAYTMAVLSFIALSFFGAFAIRPAIREIFELNRKIADRRLVNQKLDEKIKNLKLAEGEYEKIRVDLPLILAALPQDSSFPPLLKAIEDTATSSAVSLESLNFQKISLFGSPTEKPATISAGPTSPNSFPFGVKIAGSYPNLFSFLEAMEKGARLVNIDELSFVSEKRGIATPTAGLNMAFGAKAYFLPNKIVGMIR